MSSAFRPALVLFLGWAVGLGQPLATVSTAAQTPSLPSPRRQEQPASDEVVRVTTNLVQIDAVVTDKDGRVVSDLTADDFEVYEEGKPQPITNFSFVAVDPSLFSSAEKPANPDARSASEKKAAAPPPIPIRRENVQRTIALIADDICMTLDSADRAREALNKFVDEQMRPGDLVAVFRTRGEVGALQQFTTDKTQLRAAIKSIRWYPPKPGDFCSGAFADARSDYTAKYPTGRGPGQGTFESPEARASRLGSETIQRENSTLASLNVLSFVVQGLRRLPGRKSAVVISDAIAVIAASKNRLSSRALDSANEIVNQANRAAVVIYAIDSRTLDNPYAMTAGDEVLPDEQTHVRDSRSAEYNAAQSGSSFLAYATGGLFLKHTDLNRSLRRMMQDQSGYYLIGYRPSAETFQRKAAFRNISVRVKRPGVSVRSRSGFFGITDEEARPRPRSNESALYEALASPLATAGVRTRLTPMFGRDERAGYFIRALLYLDPRDFTFTEESDGSSKLAIDVAAVTLGEKGAVYDEFTRSHTAHFTREQLAFVQRNGLVYTADVPVKKPGPYTFRIAVRDTGSGRIGSAGQFLLVPDLANRNTFTLSAIMLAEASDNGNLAIMPPAATAQAAIAAVPAVTSPAVRRFQPGMSLAYAHLIFNPRTDDKGRAHLTTQVLLFREGQEIFRSPEKPLDVAQQSASEPVVNRGRLRLPAQLAAGDYVLQIIVNDDKSGEKRRTVSQWIDFEVVAVSGGQ